MNNYIEMYCEKHNLNIGTPECKYYGDRILTDATNSIVATFSKNDDMINFIQKRKKYKKSDLLLFIIEGVKAH